MHIKRLLIRFVEEVFPFVVGLYRSGKITSKLELDDLISTSERYKKWMNLSLDILDELIKKERERGKAMEEKISKMTAFIAVALTIGSTFFASLMTNYGGTLKPWIGLILGVAFIYVFIGGWIGSHGIATRKSYGYGADWEVAIKEGGAPKTLRVDALVCWEISNINMALLNEAAIQCIRNGFLLFVVGVVLALVQPTLVTQNILENTSGRRIISTKIIAV
jgi:hypothetical protein